LLQRRLDHKWIAGIMVVVYVCVQCYCIPRLSVNYDEGLFANYGTTIIKLQRNKDVVKFDSKLPITALNMLPRAVEQVFHPGLKKPDSYQDIIWGRYITLIATLILALVVYHWSTLLYGGKASLYCLAIFLLCPNFLAHGIFVSSDIFACLFMTTGFYFLWKFGRTRQVRHFVYASFLEGLAQVSKFSMIHLLILFALLLTVQYISEKKALPAPGFTVRRLMLSLFLLAGINWFVISAAHLFYGMFVPYNPCFILPAIIFPFHCLLLISGVWMQ
jgi:Dolichyl-phosphate-mannose-protein mannosyltransferase